MGKSISPSLVGVQVGQTVHMHAFEIRSDCNGWEYQVEQGASWNSSNQQVATVSGSQITFVGGGQTTIKASWSSSFPASTQCAGNPGFLPGPEPIGPTVCCTNRPLPQSVNTGVIVQRPTVVVTNNPFNPASVTIGGSMDTSTGSADIAASSACELEQCLRPGDFVVVEIIKNTAGGNFTFTRGDTNTAGQIQLVPLMLGSSVGVSFKVEVMDGTPAGPRPNGTDYAFTIRVMDVRRPNSPQSPPDLNNSTSLLPANPMLLQPASGGVASRLKVFLMN